MARRTQTILVDDIDGSEASQTVTFALDGVTYEIDLTDEHAAALRESFEEWTSKGRRTGGRRHKGRPAVRNSKTTEMREWLLSQGREVSTRGRIPADLVELYNNAHSENAHHEG